MDLKKKRLEKNRPFFSHGKTLFQPPRLDTIALDRCGLCLSGFSSCCSTRFNRAKGPVTQRGQDRG